MAICTLFLHARRGATPLSLLIPSYSTIYYSPYTVLSNIAAPSRQRRGKRWQRARAGNHHRRCGNVTWQARPLALHIASVFFCSRGFLAGLKEKGQNTAICLASTAISPIAAGKQALIKAAPSVCDAAKLRLNLSALHCSSRGSTSFARLASHTAAMSPDARTYLYYRTHRSFTAFSAAYARMLVAMASVALFAASILSPTSVACASVHVPRLSAACWLSLSRNAAFLNACPLAVSIAYQQKERRASDAKTHSER